MRKHEQFYFRKKRMISQLPSCVYDVFAVSVHSLQILVPVTALGRDKLSKRIPCDSLHIMMVISQDMNALG